MQAGDEMNQPRSLHFGSAGLIACNGSDTLEQSDGMESYSLVKCGETFFLFLPSVEWRVVGQQCWRSCLSLTAMIMDENLISNRFLLLFPGGAELNLCNILAEL